MSKISVVIDTSILRKHKTLRTEEIQLIAELSRIKEINLYIPSMVQKEILSQENFEISTDYDSLINLLKNIARKDIKQKKLIEKDIAKYEKIKEEKLQLVKNKWRSFFRKNHIEIISLRYVNADNVFEDYVTGKLPFSKPKNRKDIPDSFILHSILSIIPTKIQFICCDKNLSEAAKSQIKKEITIYDSIESFIKSPILEKAIEELGKLGSVKEQFEILLSNKELLEKFTLNHINNSIPIDLLQSDGKKSKEEDKLIKLFKVDNIIINYDKARLYENKDIVIPIKLKIKCLLETKKSIEDYNSGKQLPMNKFYESLIEIVEFEDFVIIQEPYFGTLSTAINIDVTKPFHLEEKKIHFSEIRKNLLISDTLTDLISNMTNQIKNIE